MLHWPKGGIAAALLVVAACGQKAPDTAANSVSANAKRSTAGSAPADSTPDTAATAAPTVDTGPADRPATAALPRPGTPTLARPHAEIAMRTGHTMLADGSPSPPSASASPTMPPPPPAQSAAIDPRVAAMCADMNVDPDAPACRTYAHHLAGLREGTSRFRAPEKMRVGDVEPVSVVVGDTADAAAIAAQLPSGQFQTGDFSTKVGTEMGAELIASPGLTVVPAGIVQKALLPTGPTRWDWQVTAKAKGRGELELRTYVFLKLPDGTMAANPVAQSKPQYILVDVGSAAAMHDTMGGMTAWLGDATNLMKALAGLLGAALLVWVAVKKFGGAKNPAG